MEETQSENNAILKKKLRREIKKQVNAINELVNIGVRKTHADVRRNARIHFMEIFTEIGHELKLLQSLPEKMFGSDS